MCPVGMSKYLTQEVLEDMKENWREWVKFVFLDVPTDIIKGIV